STPTTPTATPTSTTGTPTTATATPSATTTLTPTTPTATPTGATETPTTATATVTASKAASATSTPTGAITETASVTPTDTPTGSPTPTPALGGNVRYYHTPCDRTPGLPVPEVDLTLSGATSATAMTDAAGNFGVTADGSDSTLRPSKQGGSNGAIDEQDAQYVLEFVAGLRQLDPERRLAANVTGNPTVAALDAALILQFSKGQLSRFPIADQCGSDWIFRPDPSSDVGQMLTQPQTGGGGGCVMG